MVPEARGANFRYYESRTGHGSSLSPSIHALMAARLGDGHLAQQYVKQASEIDLGNNMGNAAGGVHAAALGGLWQAMVFGFGGLRTQRDGICLAPNLLSHWRRLSFPLQWRKSTVHISIEPSAVRIAVEGGEPVRVRLDAGSEVIAAPRQEYMADRAQAGWNPWRMLH